MNYATGRWYQTLTLKNTSGGAITGPVSLLLTNLSSNARLTNATGVTTAVGPLGTPYLNLDLGVSGIWAAGQTLIVTLEFTRLDSQAITYDTRFLAGSGTR